MHVPAKALKKLYHAFNERDFEKDLYITVFYGILNLSTQEFTFCNAGHNCRPVLIQNLDLRLLDSADIPISDWLEYPEYTDKSVVLSKGDRLLFYTDGVCGPWFENTDCITKDSNIIDILNANTQSKTTINLLEKYILSKIRNGSFELKDDLSLALLKLL